MRYDAVRNCIVLGVRELCRAACASGNLSAGSLPGSPEEDDAAVGTKLHRVLAEAEGDAFRAEVPLECEIEDGGICYLLRGRADGVLEPASPNGLPTVVEFKTVSSAQLEQPPARAHTLQLRLYAYMLASLRGLPKIRARLTAALPDALDRRDNEKEYKTDDLEFSLRLMLSRVRLRAELERDRAREVLPRCEKLPFPHPSLREGQRELIGAVCSAVKQKKRLFAQAPTGIGKTVSVLYGAVRAMNTGIPGGGNRKNDDPGFRRIFYLTAKASTRREAYAAAGRIFSAGAALRTVVLNAKEQTCPASPHDGGAFLCDPDTCPLAKGYYDKRDDALRELLESCHGYPASTVAAVAAKYGICPYELTLDLSEYCDIIICDYNYAFDPGVKLRRYFADGGQAAGSEGCVFLVDEAHNLTERARDMYSAVLTGEDLAAFAPFAEHSPRMREALGALSAALGEARELCREDMTRDEEGREYGCYFSLSPLPGLDAAVSETREAAEIFFFSHKTDPEAARAAAVFLRILRKWGEAAGAYDEKFRTYIEVNAGRVSVKLFCLDPSGRLGEALSAARAAVFFSATLTPSDYFSDVLGGGKGSLSLSLPSPFPRENLGLYAVTSVSTRYDDRQKSAKKLAAVIAATASGRPGNYIVYFPSYQYMEAVLEPFRAKYPKVEIAVQSRGMTRAERDSFLSFFREDTGKLRIGFCVLGGSFSEGVDLPGSRLIGTVIVGVGLPGLSAERNMIRDYYETHIERGYDYAYTYPGMNAILQAAGRVIRRNDDRGVVVLADDRYAAPQYRALMPPHWEGIRMIDSIADLPGELKRFWNG